MLHTNEDGNKELLDLMRTSDAAGDPGVQRSPESANKNNAITPEDPDAIRAYNETIKPEIERLAGIKQLEGQRNAARAFAELEYADNLAMGDALLKKDIDALLADPKNEIDTPAGDLKNAIVLRRFVEENFPAGNESTSAKRLEKLGEVAKTVARTPWFSKQFAGFLAMAVQEYRFGNKKGVTKNLTDYFSLSDTLAEKTVPKNELFDAKTGAFVAGRGTELTFATTGDPRVWVVVSTLPDGGVLLVDKNADEQTPPAEAMRRASPAELKTAKRFLGA
jgi:hypothetical protein